MKDAFDQILEVNKDLVELQKEKAALLPKFCERCGKDLKGYTQCRCRDDIVRPNEYMTWTSVSDEHGGIGAQTYMCCECTEHFKTKRHWPDDPPCDECVRFQQQDN